MLVFPHSIRSDPQANQNLLQRTLQRLWLKGRESKLSILVCVIVRLGAYMCGALCVVYVFSYCGCSVHKSDPMFSVVTVFDVDINDKAAVCSWTGWRSVTMRTPHQPRLSKSLSHHLPPLFPSLRQSPLHNPGEISRFAPSTLSPSLCATTLNPSRVKVQKTVYLSLCFF